VSLNSTFVRSEDIAAHNELCSYIALDFRTLGMHY
jgi:hypothetical protein